MNKKRIAELNNIIEYATNCKELREIIREYKKNIFIMEPINNHKKLNIPNDNYKNDIINFINDDFSNDALCLIMASSLGVNNRINALSYGDKAYFRIMVSLLASTMNKYIKHTKFEVFKGAKFYNDGGSEFRIYLILR